MAANCTICKLDVPSSLAILKCCNYVSHLKCVKEFINKHGRCPNSYCLTSATEADIIPIICDPPRQQQNNSQNVSSTTCRVNEALTALKDRLKEFRTGSDQENAQIGQLGEAFEKMLHDNNKKNNGCKNSKGGPSTSANDDNEIKETGWEMFIRIIKSKEVRFIVLAVGLALLCIFFWEIIVPAGGFAQATEIISGLLATLRKFAPQMAVAIFGCIKAFFFFQHKLM